ncbi:squalene/phytoene synthase family protein, partial [Rhodococcus hoagii]|nr:squalene/phytoene synthase family protein [Prescottella equi]
LPTDELAAFGVDEELLRRCRSTGRTDPGSAERSPISSPTPGRVYRAAEPGLDMLDPAARPAIRTAFVLYADILREVEDGGYRVLCERAVVSRRRRLAVAVPQLLIAGRTSARLRRTARTRARAA